MDSTQQKLDNISREPHEFRHSIGAYQVLASQSNVQAEQTLGLFHTEQSLRNVKALMDSRSQLRARFLSLLYENQASHLSCLRSNTFPYGNEQRNICHKID